MNQSIRVKSLKSEIKRNGYTYQLVERDERRAIYKQETYGYEVFKIKQSKPHPKATEDLINFDKVEVFPNDEDFGVIAWHVKTLEDAQKRYALI